MGTERATQVARGWLLVSALVALLAACGGPPESSPTPLPSTLSYQGQTQTGQVGSFCWHDRCGELGGFPMPAATLTVPADAVLTLTFSGASPPRTLDAAAYPLTKQSRTQTIAGGRILYPEGQTATPLPAAVVGLQAEITARLPAGEYVLHIVVGETAPGESSASYGFHLIVK